MDSKAVLARFEAERQALALMDHPNIAKVLDAGTTDDGRPFFVMELVKGVPITKFCDARKLTPRQRLELFVPVCQAIQHAHQKGIIHRDIKPSNVLVALYDDRPVPKVIDFGVAKATGHAADRARRCTPASAPSSARRSTCRRSRRRLNNLDIDTRSDIYSLGVLLYELLTGSPPFRRKELEKAGMLEMLRVIREEEPPQAEHEAEHGGRAAEPGGEPQHGAGEADAAAARRARLDRDEGAGEGAVAALRDGQRLGAGHPALPGGRAGAGGAAERGLSAEEVRQAAQRPSDGGEPGAAGGLLAGMVGTTVGLIRARWAEAAAAADADRRRARRRRRRWTRKRWPAKGPRLHAQ